MPLGTPLPVPSNFTLGLGHRHREHWESLDEGAAVGGEDAVDVETLQLI